MNYITDAAGCQWSIRFTEVGARMPERAYALQRMDGTTGDILPGVIGFYAPSIDAAKRKLGVWP